jgi:hypothetical protein
MDQIHLVNLEQSGNVESFHLISMIPRSGKQGILGIIKSLDDNTQYVFKISQYFNYTCRQEHQVMKDLEEMKDYCPHFCRTKGIYRGRINPNFRDCENVFDIENVKTPIEVDVLLMELIDGGRKFCRYIINNKVEEEVLFSIMKQTMISIAMAQRDVSLTHYDLHSNNILITETDPNTLHYYIMEDGRSYIVPTYGFKPIVIDFGFSYSKGMEGKPLYGALAHTNVGFMSSCYDDCGDSKLLLSTVSWEMDANRGRKIHKTFKRDCKDLLRGLEIDLDSGWDKTEKDMSASDYLLSLIDSETKKSRFFDECGHFAVDIIQYLIRLPLRPRNVPEIYQAFILVRNEFMKLEKEIGSTFFLLYIFKGAVEAVSDTKDEYMHGDERKALQDFRHRMYSVIESVAKYARAKIDYEKLYVGLLGMARAGEGLLYKVVSARMKDKERQKRRMEIRDIADMHHLIYYKYQDDYDLTKDSKIVVFDQLRKTSYTLNLPLEIISQYNKLKKLQDRCDWLFELCETQNEDDPAYSSEEDEEEGEEISDEDVAFALEGYESE